MEYIKFKLTFTCVVAIPSGSGKSVLVKNILKNFKELTDIDKKTIRVKWCYKSFSHCSQSQ